MNVQNTEAWNVFRERSEQGVSAVRASLGPSSARLPCPEVDMDVRRGCRERLLDA